MQLLIFLQRLRLDSLYLPVLLPNFRIVSMQMSPVMTEKDELAVQNVTQLIKFLTGGTGTMSLGSMTPSLAREVTLLSFQFPLFTHARISVVLLPRHYLKQKAVVLI